MIGLLWFFFYFIAAKGISLFAFHGKLNEPFNDREDGKWSTVIDEVKNRRYTFVDRVTKLKVKN